MKKALLFPLLFGFIVLSFFSCKENTSPEITYLYVSKVTDISFSENINVKVTASDEDDDAVTSTWECTGGSFTGTGNEVVWVAPAQVGTYTITVKVSDGEKTVTQSKDVSVVGSYFFNFGQAAPIWSFNASTTARTYVNGIMTLWSNDVANINYANYYYNPATAISIPFSIKTRIAINVDDIIAATSPRFQLNFQFPVKENADKYLRTIMWYVYPTVNKWQVRVEIYNTLTASSEFQDIDVDAYSNSQAIFTESNQYHTFGMAITADKKFILSLDGAELYTTTALATNDLYFRDLTMNKFSYSVAPGLKILVDDFYVATDGTVLK